MLLNNLCRHIQKNTNCEGKFEILEITRNLGGKLKKLFSTLTFTVQLHEITSWPSATSHIAEAQTVFDKGQMCDRTAS